MRSKLEGPKSRQCPIYHRKKSKNYEGLIFPAIDFSMKLALQTTKSAGHYVLTSPEVSPAVAFVYQIR